MVMEIRAPSHSSSGLNVTTSPEYKLIVVGPRRVGKSALVVRFLTKRFINEYLENTEMTCAGKVCVDGELLRVNIQDSSEKSMRTTSLDHYCRWADAIMLVFSITDAESFNQLKTVLNRLMERKSEKFVTPIVLVGNKCDLDMSRKVTKDEALDLARLLQCDYYESSAREGSMTLLSSNDILEDDFDYQILRERKRSNSADEYMKGGLLGMMDRTSFEMPIKRWSSQSSLGHGLRVPNSPNNTSAASSENESDCDDRRQHKHQSRSTARAKKLLKAAGKLSPLFSRRMSPSNADKKRRNRCDANNNRNRNNNKRDNSPSPKTIPGLVVNSLRLTGSVCAIGSVTNGDLLGVSTSDLELPPSPTDYITNGNDDIYSDAWQRRRRSAASSESSSTLGNDGTYCAQPFIQLCRDAKRRRTYKSVLALSGKNNCNSEHSTNYTRTDVCRSPSQVGFHALSLLT